MTTEQKQAIRKLIKRRWLGYPAYSYAPCSLPMAANNAKHSISVKRRWNALEQAGLVRLEIEPDHYADLEDLEGDTYNVDMHEDTVPGGRRTIKAQQKAFRERVEQEGAHTIVGQFRATPDVAGWEEADSVGGFVGDDWQGSGYDDDIMWNTIDALRDTLRGRCPTCRKPR